MAQLQGGLTFFLLVLLPACVQSVGRPFRLEFAHRSPLVPMLAAARAGRLDEVIKLLDASTVAYAHPWDGRTALHEAAQRGHTAVAAVLLRGGAKAEASTLPPSARTPLMVAAFKGHVAVVELLLKHDDVDVNRADSAGTTPLDSAAKRGHVAVVAALLGAGARTEPTRAGPSTSAPATLPIYSAAQRGHVGVVEKLIAAGALINEREDSRRYGDNGTPLWIASANGHANAIHALLSAGADPNIVRATFGDTPLHIAASEGHVAAVFMLLGGGASPLIAANDFSSPRDKALAMGHVGIARLLEFAVDETHKNMQSGITTTSSAQPTSSPSSSTAAEEPHRFVVTVDIAGIDTIVEAVRRGDDTLVEILLSFESLADLKHLPRVLTSPTDQLCARSVHILLIQIQNAKAYRMISLSITGPYVSTN